MRLSGFQGKTVAVAVLALLSASGWALGQVLTLPGQPSGAMLPRQFLVMPKENLAAPINRGRYLAAAGDCLSCHSRQGGEPFAGGLGLNTPFGVIYTANITPDPDTGIGAWSRDQFYRAMHDGKGAHGENLYPAFPYPSFRQVSREDDDAIFEFLMSLPAVKYMPPKNDLPFPFSVRSVVGAWNLLYLDSHEFQTDPKQTAEWNRGAYLVNGLGHCGSCHTPKNSLGADKSAQALWGSEVDDWVTPDLTSNPRLGIGQWSVEDIAEFLGTGRNAHSAAGGAMADVISNSTALLTGSDRHAMGVYLKSQPTSPTPLVVAADAHAMHRGAEIYSDACSSCHLSNGVGQSRIFPPLGNDALVQQLDPTGLEHLILAGTQIGVSASRPSALSMPSFAWKLSDQEIADVATYVRNSWGNQAAAVLVPQVGALRKKLDLKTPRWADNSGDQAAIP